MMRIVEVLYERTELEVNNNYRVTHAAVLWRQQGDTG